MSTAKAHGADEAKVTHFQRWNLQHRLQHGILALSTMGLLWTGLAIKFHHVAWAQWTFRLFGGFHGNLIAHKVCASSLVFVSLWHLIYLLAGWRKLGFSWGMIPTHRDVIDVYHHALYLLNIRKKPPQFDRYSYLEKFEYLAIFWGMVVMGGTGFSLWFPAAAANWVPRAWLDGFRIVHGNEAVVALITLAYGHFFNAHFNPAVFPSNPVWLTGKISLEHMLEEHPVEYQRMVEKGLLPAPAHEEHHDQRLAGWRRWVAFIELIIYSAIFYYLLVTFIPMLLA